VTLSIICNIIDKFFTPTDIILLFMFIIDFTYCFPYFSLLRLSFLALFILVLLLLFYKSFNSILVSLPYSSISPFFLNFLPYLSSLAFGFNHSIETFGHRGLTLSIHTTFSLSCFSLNSILLSFLSLSGFLS
jgi:hypothetical protein